MPTFVYMTRCDGCGHCVDICPSDIMHIDTVTRRAYNIEPNMCWECYSCVKACPHQAIDVRGYADFDRDKVSNVGANPSLSRLFGDGFLAITFETGSGQRYQGVVPLEGDSLSQACEYYFSQSEQIPTIVRLGSYITADNCFVGGLLVQYLPKGEVGRDRLHARMEHPDWNHISVLSGSMSHAELIDPTLSMEALVWRLFHEEEKVLTEKGHELKKGCRCTKKHYERIISQFPSSEKDQMRNENGKIVVDCSFCSKQFLLGL